MTRSRIPAREKFLWRGWEFRLSRADAKEAHWQSSDERVQIRVIYRGGIPEDEFDPEIPGEFTAIILMHGFPAGDGVGPSAELALAHAESDLRGKVLQALQFLSELKRGKLREPGS
jgi:hypothetical protein